MMQHWSFYDAATGLFDGRRYQGDAAGLLLQLQHLGPEVAAADGEVDHLRQRIDFGTGQLVAYVPPKPVDTADWTHVWDGATETWQPTMTLAAAQREACGAIDAAAGAARLRYITDAPGQQGVYLRKAEQARAYRDAGYSGTVPPYIAAEAAATGLSAAAAADRILAIADAWDNQLSPAIERLRIAGKAAVMLAAGQDAIATVAAVRASTLSELGAL